MKLKNVPVLVYGLGITGLETIKFLKKKNAKIFIYDDKCFQSVDGTTWFDLKHHLLKIKMVVISPGVFDTKLLTLLNYYNIPIYSELKFASMFLKGKIIAVTGTNGKTTTVRLLSKLFEKAGKKCRLCGNVGQPLISYADDNDKFIYYICEVSSFQLEYLGDFKPYISALLNIAPDHIERHKNMETYEKLKFSIFENMNKNCIVNSNLKEQFAFVFPKINPICFSAFEKSDAYFENDKIRYKNYVLDIEKVKLVGKKNFENIMVCLIVCDICNIKEEVVVQTIENFCGLEHRIELIRVYKNVRYYNDSKATNPDSTCCALQCFEKNIILLLGGYDKGLDYSEIFKYKNIKYIICFGGAKNKIYFDAKKYGIKNVLRVDSVADAVKLTCELSSGGDVVLFSPACSSFDAYQNFEKRGEHFKQIVNLLN